MDVAALNAPGKSNVGTRQVFHSHLGDSIGKGNRHKRVQSRNRRSLTGTYEPQ